MLKTLLKKQMEEIFSFLFVNRKNGQRRTGSRAMLLGGVLLLSLAMVAFALWGLSSLMLDSLLPAGLDWLYFLLVAVMTLGVGVIGSIFTTYSTLYRAKDNETLLSLPIPSLYILAARMTSVLALALIFTLPVWVPAMAAYIIQTSAGLNVILCQVAMWLLLALVSVIISCLLGFLVALIAGKMKHRNAATVVLSLLGFALYYYGCFNGEQLMTALLQKSMTMAGGIEKNAPWLMTAGKAACGDGVSLLICAIVVLALFACCLWILAATFNRVVTMRKDSAGKKYVEKRARMKSQERALLERELKRFGTCAPYMLNCGLGILFLPALAVVALVKLPDLRPLIDVARQDMPEVIQLLPILTMLVIGLLTVLNDLTACSISLEAKNLWVARTLPVESRKILDAKQKLHILLTMPPVLLAAVAIIILLQMSVYESIMVLLFAIVFTCFGSAFGLAMNLKMPNLNWPTETAAVKSGMSVLVTLFGQWAILVGLGFACWFGMKVISTHVLTALLVVLMVVTTLLVNLWLRRKGIRIYEELSA